MMGWPYRFVSLSPEEIADRRRLLDLYGFYAWLSPILLLFVIYTGRRAVEYRSSIGLGRSSSQPPTWIQLRYRRISWKFNSPVVQSDFGSLKVHVFGALYASWLLFLATHQTGDDYMHLTKRLGHVAVSQLPLHYLLAVKSPLSPIQLATNLTHETLNPYHRLMGRITHLLLLGHAALYLNFFYWISVLPRRLSSRDACLGLVCIIIFNALAITTIPPIRKRAYHKAFYVPHAFLSFLLIPAISAHVPYTRKYVVQMFVAYIFNVLSRKANTTAPASPAVITPVSGTDGAVLHISISPATETPFHAPVPFGSPIPTWSPGQHVYLKAGHNPKSPRSPFSIVSAPPTLPTTPERQRIYHGGPIADVELVVRNLGGPTTAWLTGSELSSDAPVRDGNAKANGHARRVESDATRRVEVLVEGPYGASSSFLPSLFRSITDLNSDEEVLLLAGGVGATFTLPIYISLLTAIAQVRSERSGDGTNGVHAGEKGKANGHVPSPKTSSALLSSSSLSKRIHFHWIVRTQAEAEWGIEYLQKAFSRPVKKTDDNDATQNMTALSSEELNASIYVTATPTTPEKQEQQQRQNPTSPIPGLTLHTNNRYTNSNNNNDCRPDIGQLIDGIFLGSSPIATTTPTTTKGGSSSRWNKMTVLVCAPPGLTASAREVVGRHVEGWGREVNWHEEAFGLGGS